MSSRTPRQKRFALFIAAAMFASGVGLLIDQFTAPTPTAPFVSLPTGPVVALKVAGALTVSPSGALYVADLAAERILVRLPDGRFRVVAGDGSVGFSGDGGRAIDAELSAVGDLAFGPAGLYFVDGNRVRLVRPGGVITTVAGDGGGSQPSAVVSTTSAVHASLGSQISIALSPSGELFITDGPQLLRLTSGRRLEVVRAYSTSGPWDGNVNDMGPIAVDVHGNIDISCIQGWSVSTDNRSGIVTYDGYARRSGGACSVLQRASDGMVTGDGDWSLFAVEGDALVPVDRFPDGFWLDHYAFAPDGTIYADEIPGGIGFESLQRLASLSNGRFTVLWTESDPLGRGACRWEC